jgi:hypothetical protein
MKLMKMAIISIAIGIVFIGFAQGASGDDWIVYNTDEEGVRYYNNNIKKISNTNVRVWEKQIYSEEKRRGIINFLTGMNKYNSETPSYSLTLTEFDCKDAKQIGISVNIFDVKGNLIASSPKGFNDWFDVVPDSIHEQLFKKICD